MRHSFPSPYEDADDEPAARRASTRGAGPGTYRPRTSAAQDESIWVRNGHWRARPRAQMQGPWWSESARVESPPPALPPPPARSAWNHYVQSPPAADAGKSSPPSDLAARKPRLDEAPTVESRSRKTPRVTGPQRTQGRSTPPRSPVGPDPDILEVLSDRRFATKSSTPAAVSRTADVVPLQRARTRRDNRADLPEWFVTPGWKRLMSGDIAVGSEYYDQLLRSGPQHAEGWLGTAAVALLSGNLGGAATKLSRARDLDPTFPLGCLVREVCPGAPEKWYDLVGQLVGLRRRSAYQCADILLLECLQSREATEGLRQRCLRVRERIEKALDDRASRDRVKREAWGPFAGTSLRVALAQSIVLVVVILGIFTLVALLRGRPHVAVQPTAAGAVSETAETTSTTPGDAAPPAPGAVANPSAAGAVPAAAVPANAAAGPPAATVPATVAAGSAPPVTPVTATAAAGSAPPAAPASPLASSWSAAANDVSGAAAVVASNPPQETAPATDAFLSLCDDHGNGHTILLNGQPVGATPKILIVPGGPSYVITVVGGERLGDWKQRVKPVAGEQRRIIATLPASH